MGAKPFAPQREDPGFDFLQKVDHYTGRGRVLRPDCILASSTHFSVVFSLFFQCVFDAQPAFTFFCSEDIAAYVAPDSVSVGVGEFSIYLHRYLELEACTILAQFKKKK